MAVGCLRFRVLCWLVVWNMNYHFSSFFHVLGMSSSQLTRSLFFRGAETSSMCLCVHHFCLSCSDPPNNPKKLGLHRWQIRQDASDAASPLRWVANIAASLLLTQSMALQRLGVGISWNQWMLPSGNFNMALENSWTWPSCRWFTY